MGSLFTVILISLVAGHLTNFLLIAKYLVVDDFSDMDHFIPIRPGNLDLDVSERPGVNLSLIVWGIVLSAMVQTLVMLSGIILLLFPLAFIQIWFPLPINVILYACMIVSCFSVIAFEHHIAYCNDAL